MSAKSKKRLSLGKKLLKLEKLELHDVICSICQSILIEPVTLPCSHDFCHICFNGSIENNSLCCPLCRLRIGSWLRTTTKRRTLVNAELWKHIQSKFSEEVKTKNKGDDVFVPKKNPIPRLSAPGEIRLEYETELKRLREERLRVEQKHQKETELLIQKIQQEEEEAHKKYLDALQRDEILAQQMQKEQIKQTVPPNSPRRRSLRSNTKRRLKDTKIDGYLSKSIQPPQNSPILTDDNTNSTDSSTSKASVVQVNAANSPEMMPTYGKILKNLIEKKNKYLPGLWNKENGEKTKEKKEEAKTVMPNKRLNATVLESDSKIRKKSNVPSLLVSLRLPNMSLLQRLTNLSEDREEADSVDSMREELCYFQPIDEICTTSYSSDRVPPIRVPAIKPQVEPSSPKDEPAAPTRSQYLEGLCRLRHLSFVKNLPSAFVIAIKSLQVDNSNKSESSTKSIAKKRLSTSPCAVPSKPVRKNPNRNKQINPVEIVSKPRPKNLRRTRSMGSMSKDENETTPKKAKVKERKTVSDRKPNLRSSSSKKCNSPPKYREMVNNNKIKLAVKNLSSPLENCDVKQILQEQLRIEKLIAQEKNDLELARKVDAEWNKRRSKVAVKRQVTINHALTRPAKKLKV